MPRKFEGNDARRERLASRQSATLDRLHAAVNALDAENQNLQAEVGGLTNTVGALRGTIEGLSWSLEEDGFRGAETLQRAVRQLGEIVDNWQDPGAQVPGAPSMRPAGDVA